MGSPKRSRKDQGSRRDIRDRLQALAKSGSARGSGSSNQGTSKPVSLTSSNNRSNRHEYVKKEKNSSSVHTRKDSIGQVMERARTEGGSRWTKRLLEEEAKNPERWGHSGFKELYKNELDLKNRRSYSRERGRRSRSRSRDRSTRHQPSRDKEVEHFSNKNLTRFDGRSRNALTRKRDSVAINTENRGLKRSLSSSDRSLKDLGSHRSNKTKNSNRSRELEQRRSHKLSRSSNASIIKPGKEVKANSSLNTLGRTGAKGKVEDRKQESSVCQEWLNEKDRSSSRSPRQARNHSPVQQLGRTRKVKKQTLSKSSQLKAGKTERSPLSRSSESLHFRSHRSHSLSDRSSRSQSSSSQSRTSRSLSTSSSSDYSSSSCSSPDSRGRLAVAPHSPSPMRSRSNIKDVKGQALFKDPSLHLMAHQTDERSDHNKSGINKSNASEHVRPKSSRTYRAHSQSQLEPTQIDSETTSNPSSTESSDDIEEGEDGYEERTVGNHGKSLENPPRLSLSERFGKLAQLSSQRRNLELVQLRIVAPVGQNNCEKNVSVDESSAAPVITKIDKERSHSTESQPVLRVNHSPEQAVRLDDRERQRDDRWKDWHERYDQYRHVQPPRHLPRDWDDIRVRHKYYTERGYFARDMTLDELSRWEDWWHRYQQWRRGYERAWVAAHGPHVPVEYPDWTNYRSAHHRESPAAAAAAAAVVAAAAAGSIRNRLGWRR